MGKVATFDDMGGGSALIGERLRTWPPLAVAAAIAFVGSAVLTLLLVGMGLVITSSSLSGSIGGWDASVSRWFEAHRTMALNGWTDIGSTLAGTGMILAVAGFSVAIMVIRRLWPEAGFLAIGLFVEFTVFLSTTAIVDRPRPTIEPLDPLPVTSSFPSGHMAAAIVTYSGLAFLLSSHTRHTLVRVGAWALGVLFPVWVGLSRIYRGMHHPTDVLASIVLGIGALLIAGLAVRSAAVVADRRNQRAIEANLLPEHSEIRR